MGERARERRDISAKTRVYCLIGDPVGHSLSPFIMNRAFERAGLDGVYVALRVSREDLPAAVAGLKAVGVRGANVTYPHKEAVLRFAGHRSRRAEILGAANTLHFTGEGTRAHNTDAPGVALALRRFGGSSLEGERVTIFGAGGAGRAAALGVLEAGASTVVFCERFPEVVEEGVDRLKRRFPDRSLSVLPMTGGEAVRRKSAVAESDVLINATPVVAGDDTSGSLIADSGTIRPDQVCFEFTYHPRSTAFIEIAGARGATCLDGLCLLVAQALESFRRWTGLEFEMEEMARALAEHTGSPLVGGKEPA